MTTTADAVAIDGRHARRERGRAAVIDALFELLRQGRLPPTVDEIARRAGVSTASVFRYFDGIEDMQRQAFVRFRERFGHLYEIPGGAAGPRRARVRSFVDARIELYDAVGPMLAIARTRALEHDPAAEAVAANRSLLAEQVRTQFAEEAAAATPSVAADMIGLIDSITSPESWEIAQRAHGRSRRQIARMWTIGVTAVLDTLADRTPHTMTSADGRTSR